MSVAHRTYARALYEAAQEGGSLPAVREELADFVRSVRDVPELRSLLRNPQLDRRVKVRALEDVLGGANQTLRNFVQLLTSKNRIAQIEEIGREFERLAAAAEGQIEVQLTTAQELSDEEARDILGRIEQASGRRIEATRTVDSSLIGGLVLQAGSLRLDASVRGRLDRLRRELVSGL